MSFASPTLYKKTSTGKIQQWKIWTKGNVIFSESGQVDGKKIPTSDTIKAGKNVGKKTETTPAEQAALEAEAKYKKQLKKGYVHSIKDAEAGKTDAVIKGGHKLMKGQGWDKHKKKIKFPCAIQPKLDGIRAGNESEQLWSYTREKILTAEHILEEMRECGLIAQPTDGELYNHDLKDDFEVISSAVRNSKDQSQATLMQYHIYDLVMPDKTFKERLEMMDAMAEVCDAYDLRHIRFVQTEICNNEEEVVSAYNNFLDQGYEGAIVRQLDAKYEGRKGYSFLKMKLFEDAEFKVVGMEEGRGKLQGHAAKFICEINDEHGKRTFKAKAKEKQKFLEDCFKNPKLWKNRILTVTFMGYTKKNKVPRHGVGKAFRDDGW